MSPVYEFKCPQCGEKIQRRNSIDERVADPMCGDCLVVMVQVYAPTPAIFKGDGWGGKK